MLKGAAVGSHSMQYFPSDHDLKWRAGMDIRFANMKSFVSQGRTKMIS